jgi:hypothetical protein
VPAAGPASAHVAVSLAVPDVALPAVLVDVNLQLHLLRCCAICTVVRAAVLLKRMARHFAAAALCSVAYFFAAVSAVSAAGHRCDVTYVVE